MQLNIANCPKCGRVFNPRLDDVCRQCKKEIEAEYMRCAEYLRQNRGVTIYELSDETNVSIRQITKFIREGRISIADSPNLAYPCDSCGTLIQTGKLCDSCYKRLTKKFSNFQEDEKRRSERGREQGSYSGYQIKEKTNKSE